MSIAKADIERYLRRAVLWAEARGIDWRSDEEFRGLCEREGFSLTMHKEGYKKVEH